MSKANLEATVKTRTDTRAGVTSIEHTGVKDNATGNPA